MKNFTQIIFWVLLTFMTPVMGQSTAIYRVTFTSTWNESDHSSVPNNAHWSKLVGATHKTANIFWESGSLASTGISDVAELGNDILFKNEVDAAILIHEANQYIDGPDLDNATGDMELATLEVSKDFPLLTLVSMIAPSPDWFVGVNSLSLLDDQGKWKESVVKDIYAYDAGIDSGIDYLSDDELTYPSEYISKISQAPIHGNKMGTMAITLLTSTDVERSRLSDDIKIYPNPVRDGKVMISWGINRIYKIDIFDSLGSQVKSLVGSQQSPCVIQVEDLSNGIYLIKVTSHSNKSVIRKLIIK